MKKILLPYHQLIPVNIFIYIIYFLMWCVCVCFLLYKIVIKFYLLIFNWILSLKVMFYMVS